MSRIPQPTRRLLAGLSLALGASLTLPALAMPGYAHGPGQGPGHGAGQGPGHGPGQGPGHGASMMHGGPMFGGMTMRMLDHVNATPEQRAQIEQILKASADQMRAQHEAGHALRDRMMALFAQPTLDANALEALRQQQLAMHDAATRRMSATMLEIGRVLTPEQRKQLADHMTQRREMMQRHQRERHNLDAPRS